MADKLKLPPEWRAITDAVALDHFHKPSDERGDVLVDFMDFSRRKIKAANSRKTEEECEMFVFLLAVQAELRMRELRKLSDGRG